jgi:hypothetical protein
MKHEEGQEMKKLLIAVLIFVILAAPVSALAPPRSILVNGEEELAEIRKIAEANKEIIGSVRGFYNLKEINEFLSALDFFPIPIINGKELMLRTITYNPTNQSAFSIYYEDDDGDLFAFSVRDYRPMTAEEFIKQNHNVEPILLYQREDENVRIYAHPRFMRRNDVVALIMDFYGYTILFDYRNNIGNVSNVSIEKLGESLVFGSIRDLEIMHEQRTTLTTADALTVLRAATGLITLTDGQIARLGIEGAPTTADALRILRIAVGLQ